MLNSSFPMNGITIIIVSYRHFLEMRTEILKNLSQKHRVIAIATNRPVESALPYLEEKGVNTDNMIFLDTITSTVETSVEKDKRIFYEDIRKLNSIRMTLLNIIKKNPSFDLLFIDSPSTIMAHNDSKEGEVFFQALFAEMRRLGLKVIIYSLKAEHDNISDPFFVKYSDRIIELEPDNIKNLKLF